MTAVLLPNGRQQFFTTPGVPAVGYKLMTWAAGTSTPQTTWADALKIAANPNPIILDGRGEAVIFWDGAYKIQLQDATGAPVWAPVDNVQSQPAPSASLIPSVDNSFTLGSPAFSWANLYLGAGDAAAYDVPTGNIGYLARTAAEIAAGVTPTSYAYQPWRGEDVRRFGAVGDGATDNTAFLTIANTVGAALYFPPGIYAIASNLTLTVPCIFDYGAILKPANTKTVTINAPVDAGPWQIFNESVGGIIAGLIRPVNAAGRMYFEWWGAVGDNSTDDTVPCQATLRGAMTANYVGIQMLAKQYRISAQLNANGNTTQSFKAPSIYGVDKTQSQFTTTNGAIAMLSYLGGSGQQCGAVVENVGFSMSVNAGNAILINGQCGLKIKRCLFDTMNTGIKFYNLNAGAFTEYCVADECEFTFNCSVPLLYAVGAGTSSFHGSGLTRCTIVTNTVGPLIQIGAGCRVYNAPLDTQVWYANNGTLIGNSSAIQCYFRGSLTLENSGGGVLTLASGLPVPFAGTITASATGVAGGTLVQCQAVSIDLGPALTILGGRKAYKLTMAVGANTLDSPFNSQHRTVFIRLTAAGYEYRYFLSVDPSGTGAAGAAITLANPFSVNTAGYGAPVFSVNATGQLVATNGAWPAATVVAYWSDQTQSFGNESGVPNSTVQF